MEEVRQLVQEEGREARNLVAFHVAVDSPSRTSRKPPRWSAPARRAVGGRAAARRSASAGRDKRSELRARYWALLFGDLQRAIGEIYNTVEAHENLNECQEVILVLENYTRDFKALGEWFRLKWEYDNTPPPQRPQSLAWEIRKTDFVRPESRRAYSVKSSPSVSGKNSPCLSGNNTPSGKNSPNLTGKTSPGSGKISPRTSSGQSSTSPKANIEFFSNKLVTGKITAKPEPKSAKEVPRLSDIKEKDVKDISEDETKIAVPNVVIEKTDEGYKPVEVKMGKAKEVQNACPKPVVVKSPKRTDNSNTNEAHTKTIVDKLDAMENEFLAKNLTENQAKNDNLMNQEVDILVNKQDKEVDEKAVAEVSVNTSQSSSNESNKLNTSGEKESTAESPSKSEDNFADVSNESSPKANENQLNYMDCIEVLDEKVTVAEMIKKSHKFTTKEGSVNTEHKENYEAPTQKTFSDIKEQEKKIEAKAAEVKPRPAYSQAAAKPKLVSATKSEVKSPSRSTTPLARSKTVMEIRPSTVPKTQRPFQKRNQPNKCSYPFNLTTGRTSLFDAGANTHKPGVVPKKPPVKHVPTASGDARSNQNKSDPKKKPPRPASLKLEKDDKKEKMNLALEKIKDCEEYSSSDTIVTQIDMSRIESSESLKTLLAEDMMLLDDVTNSIEVLNVDGNKNDNEGWLTVKSRRLSRESKKQSKSHWANRFNQPSATTSLPTLNMIESPKQEQKPSVNYNKNSKFDRAQSEQPQIVESKKKINPKEYIKKEVSKEAHQSIKVENCAKAPNSKTEPMARKEPKIETKVEVPSKIESDLETRKETPKPEIKEKEECKKLNEVQENTTEKLKKRSDHEKDPTMIRQKSDVTGLKTRSSRSKALSKKCKDRKDSQSSELIKTRLHSSLESLTGLSRSQESTEEPFDFDKWKAEFKSTFIYLDDEDQIPDHTEILKSADPSEMSEIAEMTSQIEENERKISLALDFQSEVDQRKLSEEEDLLNRQIMELQQVSDVDLDTETDDTETDAEILCEDTTNSETISADKLGELAASLEERYEAALAGLSWADRVDALHALQALVARDPGRAQQLHAKLSQGIKRRGSLQDALRRLQAKQARAERQRQEYQTERSRKIHQLLGRVEEVKVAKNQLIEEKRLRMERRLQKAAENRDQHLKDIVRKAHDEEEKLREIAFIKQLEAENRRHEFLDQCRSHTTRLRQMRRDRLAKLEQKAAREAAVGARRQAIEAARKLHVETLIEKRRERDARREELREQRKQERGDAAREKAEGVKSRLSALAEAAAREAVALRSRIRHKQDASQLRLATRLRAIRDRAGLPRPQTTSESQEHKETEEDEADRLEQERKEKEKLKAIKKKARKLKQKLLAGANDFENIEKNYNHFEAIINPMYNKMYKVINQIGNIIAPVIEELQNEAKIDETDKSKKDDKATLVNGENGIIENGDVKKKKKKKSSEAKAEDKKPDNTSNNNDATSNKNDEITNDIDKKVNDQNSNGNKKVTPNKDEKVTVEEKSKNDAKLNNDVKSNNAVNDKISDCKKDSKSNGKAKTTDDSKLNEKTINECDKENIVTQKVQKRNEKPEGKSKKKKKNRDRSSNEKPKLSKNNSACSSLSDMSKVSSKSDMKSRVDIDTNQLERHLNELHRMVERGNKHGREAMKSHRRSVLRVLSQLISAVPQQDSPSVFSPKCVTTAVTLVSRAACGAPALAATCCASALPVHLARRLQHQMEKDLESDPKEVELTKQICDCLSVCLDHVLCATRLYKKGDDEELAALTAMRARAHTLISYICLSGCVARAEVVNEVRDAMQTLLTVCSELCMPSEYDAVKEEQSSNHHPVLTKGKLVTTVCTKSILFEGGERASAVQNLKCALGRSICGARSGVCKAAGQHALPSTARAAHLLRSVATLDHQLVQDAFSEGGWSLEFRAAVATLLSQHAPTDRGSPKPSRNNINHQRLDKNLAETVVLDLIALVGFVIVNNPVLLETICEGWSAIRTLCTLPANWLMSTRHCHVLIPTLIAVCEWPPAAAAISTDLCMQLLEDYISSPESDQLKLIRLIKQGRAKKAAGKK